MLDTTADLSQFFEIPEIEAHQVERFADLAYSSARSRERFAELLAEYRRRVEAGQADALRLAIGYYVLGRANEALEWFGNTRDSKLRRYYAGQANFSLGRYEAAINELQKAAGHGWDALEIDMLIAQSHLRAGNAEAAQKLVNKHAQAGPDRSEWHFVVGQLHERVDERQAAVESYEKSLALDPDHVQSMFRCAWLYDILGDDVQAIELYQRLVLQPRAAVNALINLAVVYEDTENFEDAVQCLQRVLAAYPNHSRARLFLRDVESSRRMVIDDATERRAENRTRLLDTPISEFELSVRARNCLKKMKIQTLGDLIKLSEPELLAYKNFGETSLNEIKALLSKRGLRLGQRPEEINPEAIAEPPAPKPAVPPGSEAILSKPVSELELSVRARRCLQRLNIQTLGDLIQHSEADLLAARNFGVTSLNEIKARLVEHNLQLVPRR